MHELPDVLERLRGADNRESEAGGSREASPGAIVIAHAMTANERDVMHSKPLADQEEGMQHTGSAEQFDQNANASRPAEDASGEVKLMQDAGSETGARDPGPLEQPGADDRVMPEEAGGSDESGLQDETASSDAEPQTAEPDAGAYGDDGESASERLKHIVEAALLAAGKPLSIDRLLTLFLDDEQPDRKQVRAVLDSLQQDYDGRGIEVCEVSTGWRIQVRQSCAPWVSRLWEEKPGRYSRALLETLSLIAYRQPITRGEIEDVRGVAVSTNIIKTLLERDWVRVVGHRDVPGRPSLYATTREFLDYFGLKGLDELPTLAEIKELDDFNPSLDLPEPVQKTEEDPAAAEESDSGEAAAQPGAMQEPDEGESVSPHAGTTDSPVADATDTDERQELKE